MAISVFDLMTLNMF